MKRGAKTSEFWIVLVGIVVGPIVTSILGDPALAKWAILASGVAVSAYCVCRTWLKLERADVIDFVDDDVEDQIEEWLDYVNGLASALTPEQRERLSKSPIIEVTKKTLRKFDPLLPHDGANLLRK